MQSFLSITAWSFTFFHFQESELAVKRLRSDYSWHKKYQDVVLPDQSDFSMEITRMPTWPIRFKHGNYQGVVVSHLSDFRNIESLEFYVLITWRTLNSLFSFFTISYKYMYNRNKSEAISYIISHLLRSNDIL